MYMRLVGADWAIHQRDFRRDVVTSLFWTALSAALAFAIAISMGRIDIAASVDIGDSISAVGALVAAWGTWFLLGNVDDTWDKEERVDPKLRPLLFKVVFFPGLVIALVGVLW